MTTFKEAVQAVPSISKAYRPGLQALPKNHSGKIKCRHPRHLTGSVNLDTALVPIDPDVPRWDYGIGFRRNKKAEEAIWIEIHPASSTHVEKVLRKREWLKEWLDAEGAPLKRLTRGAFYWIATDASIHITPHSRQARQLALAGIRGPKKPPLYLDKD